MVLSLDLALSKAEETVFLAAIVSLLLSINTRTVKREILGAPCDFSQ